ncbi:MAG: hypothetical protein LC662_11770 [Rhodothermaceae bacterium]|nr:hypothetical protein [Rhodothermaceae bacterium]
MCSVKVNEKYIMLADDNEDAVDMTVLALHQNNSVNEIVAVSNGEEALACLLHQYQSQRTI